MNINSTLFTSQLLACYRIWTLAGCCKASWCKTGQSLNFFRSYINYTFWSGLNLLVLLSIEYFYVFHSLLCCFIHWQLTAENQYFRDVVLNSSMLDEFNAGQFVVFSTWPRREVPGLKGCHITFFLTKSGWHYLDLFSAFTTFISLLTKCSLDG